MGDIDPLRDPNFEVSLESDPDDSPMRSPDPLVNKAGADVADSDYSAPQAAATESSAAAARALKSSIYEVDDEKFDRKVSASAATPKTNYKGPSSVSINSCMTYETQSPHTVYVISVIWDREHSWTVSRRFSEFSSLHLTLSGKIAGLPELPPKKMIFNLDPNFVNERRYLLDRYIAALVKVDPILVFPEVQSFLKLQEHGIHIEPMGDTVPSVLSKFRDPQFGINAIEIDEKEGIAISVDENASIASRVDSFFLNIKLPWEDKSVGVPVGCFVVWKKNSKGAWAAAVIRNYDCQAACLAWDRENRIVYVGLQTGVIKVYRLNANYSKVELLPDIAVHSARVTGLLYDASRNRLISCSRDKNAFIYDTAKKSTMAVIAVDESPLMAMCSDVANQRVFFGTESGKVLVYSYARDNWKLLTTFEGHVGVVRALYYDPVEQYLFSGGFDCSVMIWKVGPPGDEASSGRKVGALRGGPPSRIKSVVFCPKRRQVMAGHQNGAITFWNTRDGSVLNVVQPHVQDVVELQWSSDEQRLISCSRDGFCSIWSLKPDEQVSDAPVFEKKDLYAKIMLPDS
eukprot:TRINITY_DN3515_c0_g1_i1.p1 TRINITY_DN3515_c0_g1~~TRINITY_DN3515_c0_g1_i1.p1  ORF type:complete len:572 (-),score=147.64 TRINITY_DN3515_c0_g1_i1:30-1745(-)